MLSLAQKWLHKTASYPLRSQTRLTQASRFTIFTKGTDLDQRRYDKNRAEEEQLLAYYRNHMNDDKISEEDRAKYEAKVNALIKKHKEQDLQMA